MGYLTLTGRASHVEVVKRSRFAATIAPLARPDEAEALVADVRAHHPDANHVCWALVWGTERRWSDDGEPGGTAGRPMLEVLDKRGLDRVAAVVARRFGGVKLGAGGLARAYGGAVARALDAGHTIVVPDRDTFVLRAAFGDADALLRALSSRDDVDLAPATYDAEGLVLHGTVESARAAGLDVLVADLTRGDAEIQRTPIDTDREAHWK
jgi:uncharacterized YigZ family protein